jgi:hypothetical protein
MLESLFQHVTQLGHLQRVLLKVKHPQNPSVSLYEFLFPPSDPQSPSTTSSMTSSVSLTTSFWKEICAKVKEQLEFSMKNSGLETVLVTDYPRIYRNWSDFFKKIQSHFQVKASTQTLPSLTSVLLSYPF